MKKVLITIAIFALTSIQVIAKTGWVPFELVQKAAQQKANSNWGKVASGPYTTYYDLDGMPAVYVFAYRLNSSGNVSEKRYLRSIEFRPKACCTSSGNKELQRP